MWKVTKHKYKSQQQELKVCAKISELAEYSYASNAESMIEVIKYELKSIPRKNNFSANLMYRATPRNEKSLEVWKMTADGDFNYKILTLDFVKQNENPLSF